MKEWAKTAELENELNNQQLKHQNEKDRLNQELCELKTNAKNYKKSYHKLLNKHKKLQTDLRQRKRQFDILNSLYDKRLEKVLSIES